MLQHSPWLSWRLGQTESKRHPRVSDIKWVLRELLLFSCLVLQLYRIQSVVLDHHQQHTQTSLGPQSFLFEKYLLRSIVLANLRYYLEFSFFPHFKNNLSQTPVYHNSENVSSPFASLVFDLYHHLDLILTSHMDHCPGLLTDFCSSSFPLLLMKQPEWSFKVCFTLKKIHLLSFAVFRIKTYTFYYGLENVHSLLLWIFSFVLLPFSLDPTGS